MSEVRISAEQRTEFGKGAARRIRRDNKVPAVLYGHGEDPRHISLPGHDLMMALKTQNVLLTLDIGGADELALPKDVQRDPIRGFIEHVDLRPGPPRREGRRRDRRPRRRRRRAGDPGHHRPEHAVGRGRGHPHPDRLRGLDRGARRRRPDPRQGRAAAVRRHAGHRPRRPARQRHRRADRRAARGRARRGRGRGRHRARGHRRGAGRRGGRGCGEAAEGAAASAGEGDKADG